MSYLKYAAICTLMFILAIPIVNSTALAVESIPKKSYLADDPTSQETFTSLRNSSCEGTWKAKGDSDEITVLFFQEARNKARFVVQDGDKEHRWMAFIRIEGTEVVLRASRSERWDTYQLEEEEGVVTLSGYYHFEGKRWGTAKLKCTETS